MHSDRDPRRGSLADAVELFKTEFRKRYPASEIALDGAGYEDEDLDLVIRAQGDQIELEQSAAEVSLNVQMATGYYILGFVESPIGEAR
jgi:hypothetical protein